MKGVKPKSQYRQMIEENVATPVAL
jgi:hypothetical protein